MQIAVIGLGKMGFNIALNMQQHRHQVHAFDLNEQTRASIEKLGIRTATSIEELVHGLKERRILWLMIPAGGAVDLVIRQLTPVLRAGDIVIDGGNSNYRWCEAG